jgi:hypothetical protein
MRSNIGVGVLEQKRLTLLSHRFSEGGEEEFEDTKGVIRIRISKKNKQHIDQKKKYKRTNNDLQNTTQLHRKQTISAYLVSAK